MPTRALHNCAHREQTETLSRGEFAAEQRAAAERHLEQCEACRAHYRHLTADRFPKFRNYTILAEVGRGGFGVVYRAIHNAKGRTEALKVLFGSTARRAAYFENEVHLAARLRHPGIATLYEAHLHAPPLYYTMEHVAGQQLSEYLRHRTPSLEQRIEIVRRVAEAVGYAHEQGVVHRDLKPQNILIDADGRPRIVDFGIAKRLGLEEADETEPPPREGALGTFGYMSPEQLGGGAIDGRADIYSLGVLLFHVITGQPPRFAGNAERLAHVLRERHVSRANDLAAIIACAVRPIPEERYPTCAAFVRDLESYVGGGPIAARTKFPARDYVARQAAYLLRHHVWAVQAAVGVTLAAALVWVLWTLAAHRTAPASAGEHVALISISPSTHTAAGELGRDVPGFEPARARSWRLLYARLLERLGAAGPRVIVWDYFFRAPEPAYDETFAAAMRAAAVPVVVGVQRTDINGEPELVASLRVAVHSWGSLSVGQPTRAQNFVKVPLVQLRGANPPVPSLALAAFAAARFPEADAEYALQGPRLELRYRKRHVVEGQRRWERENADRVPVFGIEPMSGHGLLAGEDRAVIGRVPLDAVRTIAARCVPFEAALTADAPQLREWFAGRAVVIGEMRPGLDQHTLAPGEEVFGCQVQAAILDALLGGAHVERVGRTELAVRIIAWGALAVLLALLIPMGLRTLRAGPWLGLAAGVAGFALAAYTAWHIAGPISLEAAIAGSALLAIGGAALAIRCLHARQLRLTPAAVWSAGSTTTATTLLLPASGSESQAGGAPGPGGQADEDAGGQDPERRGQD